jgi:hypothetical protein
VNPRGIEPRRRALWEKEGGVLTLLSCVIESFGLLCAGGGVG